MVIEILKLVAWVVAGNIIIGNHTRTVFDKIIVATVLTAIGFLISLV